MERLYTGRFVTIAAANFFMVASLGAFFMLSLFIADRGGSKTDIGLIMGAMALSSVLSRPLVAEMTDRLGRKKSYTIGTAIMAFTPLVYLLFRGPLSDYYPALLLVRLFHGLGVSVCFTAAFTYVADIVPDHRLNEGIGMFGTTGLMGMAAGPALGEMVIITWGFDAFFVAGGVLGAAALLIHLPLPESYSGGASEDGVRETFFAVLKRPDIAVIAVLALLFGVGLASHGGFAAPFARSLGLPMVSIYFVAYSGSAIATRVFGGRLADRVGEERIVPYALFTTGAGFLVMMLLQNSWWLAAAGLVTGTGHGFLYPTLNAAAIRNRPRNIRGKINGVYTGGIDGGIFGGSIVLGLIGDWGGYRAVFLAAGLALMTGLLIFRLTWKRAR